MYCWQARARFADRLDPRERAGASATGASAGARLDQHLASCGACRAKLEGLASVRSLLADSARSTPPPASRMDDVWFEQAVVTKARARMAAGKGMFPSFARPLPVCAALLLMIAAVALAHSLTGVQPGHISSQPVAPLSASATPASAADLDDSVAPPREVPFVVQEDLVGARRGSIPLTTYVLEPAPTEKPILRASL